MQAARLSALLPRLPAPRGASHHPVAGVVVRPQEEQGVIGTQLTQLMEAQELWVRVVLRHTVVEEEAVVTMVAAAAPLMPEEAAPLTAAAPSSLTHRALRPATAM